MADRAADLLQRVLAQIASQRRNLPDEPEEDDADRFHEQLDRLAGAGYDVEEFRLRQDRDMYRRWFGSSDWPGRPGAVDYYADAFTVQPGVLEAKIDAKLDYFRLDGGGQPIAFDMTSKQ
jgi:hypothetical protein